VVGAPPNGVTGDELNGVVVVVVLVTPKVDVDCDPNPPEDGRLFVLDAPNS
jgi:hypothetical protein